MIRILFEIVLFLFALISGYVSGKEESETDRVTAQRAGLHAAPDPASVVDTEDPLNIDLN